MRKVIALALVWAGIARADDLVEFRLASQAEYRYLDWSHLFKKFATDLYYLGVPGNNEFSACLGYQLAFAKVNIVPFACAAMAKEEKQAGVKAAAVVSYEKGKVKADAYYAHFQPIGGQSSSYDVLDTGNLTYALTKRWEGGVSTGFFRQNGDWNPQYGPLVRFNDTRGFWAASFRTGSANELRFGRVLNFGKH